MYCFLITMCINTRCFFHNVFTETESIEHAKIGLNNLSEKKKNVFEIFYFCLHQYYQISRIFWIKAFFLKKNKWHRYDKIFTAHWYKYCFYSQGGVSIVRELHVYGSVVPVSARDPSKFQHQGFGQLLMEEAENIAKNEHMSYKLAVISGVGTRNYYR